MNGIILIRRQKNKANVVKRAMGFYLAKLNHYWQHWLCAIGADGKELQLLTLISPQLRGDNNASIFCISSNMINSCGLTARLTKYQYTPAQSCLCCRKPP